MNVAKGIRTAFEASEMSLTEFARRAGVKPQTAHGWVNGTHGVKPKRLRRVAKVLGVSLADLGVTLEGMLS
jgi:transcriptional regulator with XRE-family HTH domain